MKPCALFSVFTKYSYCHVHRFADNERMELTAALLLVSTFGNDAGYEPFI